MGDIREELAFHAIDTKKLGRESLQLLGAIYKTASLPAFVTKNEGKTQHGCQRNDPPDESSPVIKSKLRKQMH